MTLIVATVEESKTTELDDCQRSSSYRGVVFYFLVKSKQEPFFGVRPLEKKDISVTVAEIYKPEEELYHLSKGGGALVGGKFKLLKNINYTLKIARQHQPNGLVSVKGY